MRNFGTGVMSLNFVGKKNKNNRMYNTLVRHLQEENASFVLGLASVLVY
jgi:hypothetical protein